ncbi:uncharacterized protein LOC132634817 [Lycium barbarum]|uniref:uncharacterized protein LOC132634817 n=1 Tax=Lycium barbarum TaxID=112863 RepID=UPI00293E9E14|nr:uncharacterized protein LOC132634817 [Lycium barbarum]XP_060206891.1 uncharacterized protein LOC132634817 [Lycium barbarum]
MSTETKPVVTSLRSYELKPVAFEAASIPELITYLKSAFRDKEFSLVERILIDREKQLNAEIENLKKYIDFVKIGRDDVEMLSYDKELKDMERKHEEMKKEKDEIEANLKRKCEKGEFEAKLKRKCEELKKERDEVEEKLKRKCEDLQNEKDEVEVKLKMYIEKFKELEVRMLLLEEDTAKKHAVDVSVIQKLVEDLEADMDDDVVEVNSQAQLTPRADAVEEDDVVEMNCQASGADEKRLSPRVLIDSTGNGSDKSGDKGPPPVNMTCENRAPIVDLSACEAGDCVKNNLNKVFGVAGSSTVVHINDSDDENAKACVSNSNAVGRNLTSPHKIKEEDIKGTPLSKRKRSLSESDHGDSSVGTQKTRSIQELDRDGKLPFAHENSHKAAFVRRCDDKDGGKSYSQLSSRRSDLYKLDIGDDSSSESDDPLSDKSMNLLIKRIIKREMFSSEDDLRSSFEKDPELCMKAICALYRQKISPNISSKGLHFTKSQGLSQSDKISIAALGEYLIDGDRENKLRKAVEEVRPKDHAECKRLATKYCYQLYQIYLSKEDPLFSQISKF